jgi:hypothetical protein
VPEDEEASTMTARHIKMTPSVEARAPLGVGFRFVGTPFSADGDIFSSRS